MPQGNSMAGNTHRRGPPETAHRRDRRHHTHAHQARTAATLPRRAHHTKEEGPHQ